MKTISSVKIIGLILCIAFFFASCAHAGVISGREPKSGVNVLNLDNSEGEFDAVAVLIEEGWLNPICSIFIPAGGSYTLDKVPTGSYEIYYILGEGCKKECNTQNQTDNFH